MQAVNLVGAEDYLLSVVSAFPADVRKEKALGLRTTLMQTIRCRQEGKCRHGGPSLDSTPELVTWLEHKPQECDEADQGPVHSSFDVCATAHCSVYDGLTPRADASARAVIDETWGQVLE